jgi:protein-tyrosine phosphatase
MRLALRFLLQRRLWRLGRYREFGDVRWDEVRRLVFVCSGNICRSSYAEYWARRHDVPAVSIGVRTFAGKPAASLAMKVARDRGVSLDEHRTTPVEDFEPELGDLLVAMEPWQAQAVLDRPEWGAPYQVTLLGLWIDGQGPAILDPYGSREACFHHSLSLVEEGIAGMVEAWKGDAAIPPRGAKTLARGRTRP